MILKWFLIAATILNVVAYVVPTRADESPHKACVTIEQEVEANPPASRVSVLSDEDYNKVLAALAPIVATPPAGAKTGVLVQFLPDDQDDKPNYRFSVHGADGCMLGVINIPHAIIDGIFGDPT